MNLRALPFIISLVLISIVTTLVYQNTQQADINYYRGHKVFEKGEYDKAIKFYEKALIIDLLHLDALKELAHSYQWTGRHEKAIALYEKVIEIEDDIGTKRELAALYVWNNQPEKAKDFLETILKDNPHDSEAKLLLAKIMHYSGRAQEAIKIYEELLREEEKEGDKVEEQKEIEELLSEAYMISKDYESAIGVYREILKKEPENVKARIALAEVLSWQKEYDQSIREYEKVLKIEPDNLEVKEKLAKVYTWKIDYKKAEDLYKDILKEGPQDLDILASLSQILIRSKRYAEATHYIKLALSKKEDPHLRFLYGEVLLLSGRYKQAKKVLKDVIARNPENIRAKVYLADIFSYNKEFDEAISLYKEALKEKKDLGVKRKLAQTYSWKKDYEKAISLYKEVINATVDIETERELAEVYIWNGQYDKAKDILELILKTDPQDSKSKFLLAKAMHYSGEQGKAIYLYEELLKMKPEDKARELQIKELLSQAYMINNNYEGAISLYREILKEEPENVKARVTLADILGWLKEYDDSISEYEKALEIEPANLEIKEKLAKVYTWKEDYKKAEVLYKDIIRKTPENTGAYVALGRILAWDKRYSEAVHYFEIGLSKKEDPNLELLYGQALLYSGDYKRAKEIFQGVIDKQPGNREARVHLADALAYGKEYDKATAMYRDVLQTEENREVKKKLAEVLSWDKQYRQALDLYDEMLAEKDDLKIRLQRARILGWSRKYGQSLREYQLILDAGYDELVELEMNAKRAYWSNRIKHAIYYYNKLIEKDTENAEAMFDLSQVYSYQSMWEEAISEYKRILEVSPNHLRAKEALQKVEFISSRVSLKTGYQFFEADSKDRVNDIRKHTFFNRLSYPVDYNLRMDVYYNLTSRSFSDFSDVRENEGGIKITYRNNPTWWLGGFYDFIDYNKNIDSIDMFGGSLHFRTFDIGISSFSYQRERLDNSSAVIRDNYYRDNVKGRLDLDISKRFKWGIDYLFSDYSDDNFKHEPGVDMLYYLSLEPEKLTVQYRYFYKDFADKMKEYFSPQDFWTHTLTFNWRHFLNKEEVFFGADDLYYDLTYDISVDSEDIVGHKFGAELNWDVNKRLNFNIRGALVDTSDDVYKDKSITASVKYYFGNYETE